MGMKKQAKAPCSSRDQLYITACATVHHPYFNLNTLVKSRLRLFVIEAPKKSDLKFDDTEETLYLIAGLLNILESHHSDMKTLPIYIAF